MTMRFAAKFYPHSDAEAVKAKDALEQIKRDVLVPRGVSVSDLVVVENQETPEGTTVPQKVVKIEGWVHLDK